MRFFCRIILPDADLRLPGPWLSLTAPRIDGRMSSGQIAMILKRFESLTKFAFCKKVGLSYYISAA